MSIEEVASVVDINLNILPDMERELDQTCKALAKKQVQLDILDEEEKRRRNRIVTLPPSSYYSVESPAMNAFPYYSASRQSPSSPYWPSGNPDPWTREKIRDANEDENEEEDEDSYYRSLYKR
jgi:hypothetical protein